MQLHRYKILLLATTTALFVIGFVINITSDSSLYNLDLNVVGVWQRDQVLGSEGFMQFMNVVSELFDPPICAGYIALFWVVSARKMEIMVFLVWFISLSWLLSIFKAAIHQPRPFWQSPADPNYILMKSWVCYTQFGCPSGHAWLGLVLMEFVVRFFARGYRWVRERIIVFYVLILVLQMLVMFSRVILGMHTFNEVLMGTMIALFAISVYYAYVQSMILHLFANCIASNPSHSDHFASFKGWRRNSLLFVVLMSTLLVWAIDFATAFGITYDNIPFWAVIQATKGCDTVKYYKSFQYRCLQDSAIIMAAIAIVFSFLFNQRPCQFTRTLSYSRLSLKFLGRVLIQIVCAAIPLAIFLNPLWDKIDLQTSWKAVLIWICQTFAFFTAIVSLLLLSPALTSRAGLELYDEIKDDSSSQAQIQLESNKRGCLVVQ